MTNVKAQMTNECLTNQKGNSPSTFDIDGDTHPYDVPSVPNNPSTYDMGSDEYVP